MGIVFATLAFIPDLIAHILIVIGAVWMILGKKRDKRPLFIGGLVATIIGIIIVAIYAGLIWSNFFAFYYKMPSF